MSSEDSQGNNGEQTRTKPLETKLLMDGKAELTVAEVKDTRGIPYRVDYVRLTEPIDTRTANMLDVPIVQENLSAIIEVTKERFPAYTDEYIRDRYLPYINNADGLDIVTAPDGHVAGFHFYKIRPIEGFESAKSMYTHYAAVKEDDEGGNLTAVSRKPALDKENPDVIAGSTGNPAIYITNSRLAQERGLVFYPTNPDVPPEIVQLGQQIVTATQAEPEPRPVEAGLRRTYGGPVARGKGPSYPFFDETMNLGPNQQVLYLLIKPEFNARVIEQSE